jgi:hypothetical protein
VFISNLILRKNFNSRFRVELFPDGSATIIDTTPIWVSISETLSPFLQSFFITIVLELFVTFCFLSANALSKKILVYVFLANILSVPIVWFVFPVLKLPVLMVIVMSEIFAVLFETYFIQSLNKQISSFKQLLVLCIVNNSVSFLVGGFILFFIKEILYL